MKLNFNYDISIIVPGIRNEHWQTVWEQTKNACKRYKWEMIFCGPAPLPDVMQKEHNIKYIKDFGSPTRAVHISSLIAEGRFMTWLADDAHIYADSIDMAIDLLLSKNAEKDIITMRYSEGPGHSGACPPDAYWTAGYHGDLKLAGINPKWAISCVMMLSQEYYRALGGLDCRFHHVNMNVHDFVFRAQRNGSEVYLSPSLIMNCDFEVGRTPESHPVINAYHNNDYPLFYGMYAEPGKRDIYIDPENWRTTEPVWSMRFKK